MLHYPTLMNNYTPFGMDNSTYGGSDTTPVSSKKRSYHLDNADSDNFIYNLTHKMKFSDPQTGGDISSPNARQPVGYFPSSSVMSSASRGGLYKVDNNIGGLDILPGGVTRSSPRKQKYDDLCSNGEIGGAPGVVGAEQQGRGGGLGLSCWGLDDETFQTSTGRQHRYGNGKQQRRGSDNDNATTTVIDLSMLPKSTARKLAEEVGTEATALSSGSSSRQPQRRTTSPAVHMGGDGSDIVTTSGGYIVDESECDAVQQQRQQRSFSSGSSSSPTVYQLTYDPDFAPVAQLRYHHPQPTSSSSSSSSFYDTSTSDLDLPIMVSSNYFEGGQYGQEHQRSLPAVKVNPYGSPNARRSSSSESALVPYTGGRVRGANSSGAADEPAMLSRNAVIINDNNQSGGSGVNSSGNYIVLTSNGRLATMIDRGNGNDDDSGYDADFGYDPTYHDEGGGGDGDDGDDGMEENTMDVQQGSSSSGRGTSSGSSSGGNGNHSSRRVNSELMEMLARSAAEASSNQYQQGEGGGISMGAGVGVGVGVDVEGMDTC